MFAIKCNPQQIDSATRTDISNLHQSQGSYGKFTLPANREAQ
jgi:hypothetical protein